MQTTKLFVFCSLILLASCHFIVAAEVAYFKPRLAVLEFESKEVDSALVQSLTELAQSRFENSGLYIIIERQKIHKVLQEQSLQLSGAVDDKTAVSVGKLLGAEKLVLGSVSKMDGKYMLSGRIVNVETGEIEISGTEFSPSVLDIKENTDKLVKTLVEKDRSAYQAFLDSKTFKNSVSIGLGYLYLLGDAAKINSGMINYRLALKRKGIPFISQKPNIYTVIDISDFTLDYKNNSETKYNSIRFTPVSAGLDYFIPNTVSDNIYLAARGGMSYAKSVTKSQVLGIEINDASVDPFVRAGVGFDFVKKKRLGFQLEAMYNHYFMLGTPLTGITFDAMLVYNW